MASSNNKKSVAKKAEEQINKVKTVAQSNPQPISSINLDDTELYFNRELSWLEFNERVLGEAVDKNNPVLERLKFIAITSSNLDEFFMVRVSGLMDQVEAGFMGKDPSGMTSGEQLDSISKRVHEMVQQQYNTLNRSILPLMQKENIFLLTYDKLKKEQKAFCEKYFDTTLYPILTPMAIDQSRPFPLLSNKSINIIVELDDIDEELFAVVQVPSVVPRILEIPGNNEKTELILIGEIIKMNCHKLFNGHNVINAYLFRITRNSDFTIDEEDTRDLLIEIEQSLKRRKWGEPVRLEIEKDINNKAREFLKKSLDLTERDIYEASGPIDLTFCMKLSFMQGFDHLRDKPLEPLPSIEFEGKDVFEVIREKDVLMHHPYTSFDAVVNYVKAAAVDPNVLAIKQTLYRVSGNSPIVAALMQAAENGKQVTVLVELKARFDEENNILWAKKLEKSGCHVIYGLVGLKTHCKICLVVRKDDDGIRRYIHLGTGNYNDSTAKIYTDLGYFTCKERFGEDISALFNVLTGYSINLSWNKIAVAPISLRDMFMKHIEKETKNAELGKEAMIIAKMNSLVDTGIIKALYKASMSGVKIQLIVRGICCLKAGVKGFSENISVVSIVDRFLEHSRIYCFHNDGNTKIYLSSADWMTRNLDKRVEVAFPIEDPLLKKELLEILDTTLSDTVKLQIQNVDGSYKKVDRRGKEYVHSQLIFHEQAKKKYDKAHEISIEEKLRPNLEQ